jgi:predicted alpha/beta-fold hydrolase
MQTVLGRYWFNGEEQSPDEFTEVTLPDGDKLVLAENYPATWEDGQPIVVLVHGLVGSYKSSYMIRWCKRFTELGNRVVRVNLRGCGPGFGKARYPYHSGRSDDLKEVLWSLSRRFPSSPLIQIGVSLGANITLKMAGENQFPPQLQQVAAISAPLDMSKSAKHMIQAGAFFEQYFVGVLKKDIARLAKQYPDLSEPIWPEKVTHLKDIDDLFTAPQGGYKDAEDYYTQCSSKHFVPSIKIPTLIIFAKDDPVIDPTDYENPQFPDEVQLVVTKHGGHAGFLGPSFTSPRWLDDYLCQWL